MNFQGHTIDSSNSYKSLDHLHKKPSLSASDSLQNVKFMHEIEALRRILVDFNRKHERLSPPKPTVESQLRSQCQALAQENEGLRRELSQAREKAAAREQELL